MKRLRMLAASGVFSIALGGVGTVRAEGWQAEVGGGTESLDNGSPDWRQLDVTLRRTFAARSQWQIASRTTERFGQRDAEFGASASAPLGDWNATLGATASTTHRVLARWGMTAGVQRPLGAGWVVGADLRTTRYDAGNAQAVSIQAERYAGNVALGDWRVAATLTQTWLSGASATAMRVQLDRYFGERGRLGLLLSEGREIDNPGQGALRISRVRSAVLLGRLPITPAWALTGELGQHRVGAQYRRTGGRVGVQLDF